MRGAEMGNGNDGIRGGGGFGWRETHMDRDTLLRPLPIMDPSTLPIPSNLDFFFAYGNGPILMNNGGHLSTSWTSG